MKFVNVILVKNERNKYGSQDAPHCLISADSLQFRKFDYCQHILQAAAAARIEI